MRITTIRGESIDLVPGVTLEGAILRDLNLAGIDLAGSCLRECFFNESNLANASLRSCDLSGSVFFRTNLIGADLSEATLHRCYWNEVIHDSTTRWPTGFTFPDKDRALTEPDPNLLFQYFPTGLCTAGVIPEEDLDIISSGPTTFVPRAVPFGRVTDVSREILFLRLAALLFRACKTITLYDFDSEDLLFPRDNLVDYDDYEDVIFTHICMSLLVMGLRVQTVLDQQRVEVTFRPSSDLSAFLDSPQMRLFFLLFEALCGFDHDVEPDIANALTLNRHSHVEWVLLDDRQCNFDLTRAFSGVDRAITFATSRQQSDDARTEISEALLRFLITMTSSLMVLEDDDGKVPNDTRETKSHVSYVPDALVVCAWHLLGVEEISRGPDGTIRAILCPRMDVETALAEIGYPDPDLEDSEEEESAPYVTRPRAGRFSGHLK